MLDAKYSISIIKPLLLGVLSLNLLIVLITTVELYNGKLQAEKRAAIDTQNLSKVLEISISGLVDKIDLGLLAATDEIQNQMAMGRVDARKFTEFLKLQNRRVPDLFNLRVTNEDGDLRYGSDFSVLPVVNYADRDYFLQQRDNPKTGLFIAKPVLGKTTKKWLLTFSRRINKPDNSFGGVVYATINLEHFSDLFAVVEVGAKGSISLRDDELGIIANSGGLQLTGNLVGNKKLSEPFALALKQNPNKGTYISGATSIDQISRTHSYLKFEKYPFYINSGLEEKVYLAAWHTEVWEVTALILVFIIVSAAFSAVLIRLLRRQHSYEEDLFEQKEYLRTIIKNEPECIKVIDARGVLTQMNPAGLAMIEAESLEQVAGNPVLNIIAPEYRSAFVEMHKQVIAGEAKQLEFEVIGLKGGRRWLETHAVPMKDHGKTVHLAVTRDISDRKKSEAERDRLLKIIEDAPDFIATSDLQGHLQFLNKAGASMVGFSDDVDLSDVEIKDVHPEWGAKRVLEVGIPTVLRQGFWQSENALRHRDGHEIPVSQLLMVHYDASGKPQLLSTIMRDITESKQIEADLLRSNTELEQFSYSISHDMRQPLRMISSYLQLLEDTLKDQLSGEKREYFNFAIDGAKRMDQMMMGLLEYSRIGRKGEPQQWIESRAALDEALLFLMPAISEAQAVIKTEGVWPRVFVSPDEMLRLLQNLIGNALKFRVSGRTPEVSVTSQVIDKEWCVTIEDNGVGILPDQIGRLFQVFQRLQSRTVYDGNGIGLALCRKIVEHHGGKIWAESEGVGHGSRFIFKLPMPRPNGVAAN